MKRKVKPNKSVLMVSFLVSAFALGSATASSVTVGIGESGTQVEAGAFNTSKDGLAAEVGKLWGVSNTANRDGLLYFTYSALAGFTLPSTIQPGSYTFSARIGASSVGAGFSGLNDITAGTNTEQGSVAGFFMSLGSDAQTAKNNMVTEFNAQSGVTYTPPVEADPANLTFTTWTFTWAVAEGSPVIGTDPYFGVYTKTGTSGGNGFWDDSSLSYSSEMWPPPPAIVSFTANDHYVSEGTTVRLTWQVADAASLTLSGLGDVTGQTWADVNPVETTTYVLLASSDEGSVQAEVTVKVGPERPNILLMLVDDFGPMDTSVPFAYDSYDANGIPITTAFNTFYQTPHLEMLAANGMKFSQAYAMPMCSPTRVSLMTGQNSPRHGVTVHLNVYEAIDNASFSVKDHRGPNNWRYLGMDSNDISLPQHLKDIGYRTVMVGKDHMSHQQSPLSIGFDVSDDGLFKAPSITTKANIAIEAALEWGSPIFAYISYRDVHTGFYYAADAIHDYSAAYNTSHEKFATMVESVDNSVGAIMAKLTELGIAENTLVIFLGDNGSDSPALNDEGYAHGDAFDDFPMRGKKGSTYEGGIRVPLIVSWATPDSNNSLQQALEIPGGSVEHDMVTVEDIAPTILAAANGAVPGMDANELALWLVPYLQSMDGNDLTPYLRAEDGTHRPQKILRHMPHEHRSDYFTCFRDGDWKIIYRYHTDLFELYNLVDDPNESNNLASAQPERLLKMARAMARELNDSWGRYGKLWPCHNPEQIAKPDRPLEDDPFFIDYGVDGRETIDSDGDGLADALEDVDGDGLVGVGETDPDAADIDGHGRDVRSD